MRGTIIRRGANRWSVVVDLGRDPRTGKRIRKWHSGYPSKRTAEEARIDILARLQRGEYVAPSNRSVGSYLVEDWLPATRASVRPSTWTSYRSNVELHILPYVGSVALQRLTPEQINSMYAELLHSGRADGTGGLSPTSVRYIHAVLHRALRDAVRWNHIARNPASAAEPPRTTNQPSAIRTWSPKELRTFLQSVSDDRLAAAWFLAATTGMRRGEILGLRWSDVDLDNCRLEVSQTLVKVGYEIQRSTPKTAKGQRAIALDETTTRNLRRHRTQQAEEKLALGAGYHDHGLVFATPDGAFLHPDGFGKVFQKLQADAGVSRIRFHDLRHTHATMALRAGVHPKVVSERLGHSTVAITLDTYSHVIPALQEEAAERIAELLFAHE